MWITYSLGERRAGDAYREKEGRGVVREERREDTMLQERGGRKGKQLRGRERLLSWRKEWGRRRKKRRRRKGYSVREMRKKTWDGGKRGNKVNCSKDVEGKCSSKWYKTSMDMMIRNI